MADHVSSDHPSVHTVRATATATATGMQVTLPEADHDQFPVDEVVRVVLDGEERFARIERALTGTERSIGGVYDSPSDARNPGSGTDRLAPWLAANEIEDGSSVLVDVVERAFQYGLRAPGESTVYTAKEPPSDSLADIASELEEQ